MSAFVGNVNLEEETLIKEVLMPRVTPGKANLKRRQEVAHENIKKHLAKTTITHTPFELEKHKLEIVTLTERTKGV